MSSREGFCMTPLTPDQLGQLRSEGMSDDSILGTLIQGSPDEASDLTKLQKEGLSSSSILDGYVQFHQDNQPQQSWIDKATDFLKAPIYGASQELNRAAATEKNVLGADTAA